MGFSDCRSLEDIPDEGPSNQCDPDLVIYPKKIFLSIYSIKNRLMEIVEKNSSKKSHRPSSHISTSPHKSSHIASSQPLPTQPLHTSLSPTQLSPTPRRAVDTSGTVKYTKRRSVEAKFLDLSEVLRLREENGGYIIGNASISSLLQVEARDCEICGQLATQRYKMEGKITHGPAWLCENCVYRISQGRVTITGSPVSRGCCFR